MNLYIIMKIIKDKYITIDFGDFKSWHEIKEISEPSIIIYKTIRPSFFKEVLKHIKKNKFSNPKLFIRNLFIESFPKVISDNKSFVKEYHPFITKENEYEDLGIIYVDRYKKRRKNETINGMINNLIKENRLEVELI